MSPEQARGKSVDKRADIWAFGTVLYEMLTGRKAFEGETVSDTLAAVLTKEPDWGALPGAVPASVRRVLRRCLDRDPKTRMHDVADARLELDDGRRRDRRGRLRRSLWRRPRARSARAAWVLVARAARRWPGPSAWWRAVSAPKPVSPRPNRLRRGDSDEELTSSPTTTRRFSPFRRDGRRLVYAAERAGAAGTLVCGLSADRFDDRVRARRHRRASRSARSCRPTAS